MTPTEVRIAKKYLLQAHKSIMNLSHDDTRDALAALRAAIQTLLYMVAEHHGIDADADAP